MRVIVFFRRRDHAELVSTRRRRRHAELLLASYFLNAQLPQYTSIGGKPKSSAKSRHAGLVALKLFWRRTRKPTCIILHHSRDWVPNDAHCG